jgi:hypothetical protein
MNGPATGRYPREPAFSRAKPLCVPVASTTELTPPPEPHTLSRWA